VRAISPQFNCFEGAPRKAGSQSLVSVIKVPQQAADKVG